MNILLVSEKGNFNFINRHINIINISIILNLRTTEENANPEIGAQGLVNKNTGHSDGISQGFPDEQNQRGTFTYRVVRN